MRIGYGSYVASTAGAGEKLGSEVKLAEDVGFDGIFFSEHHGVAGYSPNPLLTAALALAQTTRLRAGPMPLLLPLHDPVRIAEDAAFVDHLSSGRLVMGLAPGYLKADFDQAGVPLAERARRYEDGLAILRRVWSGETSAFAGTHLSHPPLDPLAHPPSRPGGPPVWNAGSSKAGVRRAARAAEGLVLDSLRPTSEVAHLVEDYTRLCAEEGRPRGTVAAIRRAWFGDAQETQRFKDVLLSEMRQYVALVGDDDAPWIAALRDSGVDEAAVEERIFAGQASDVAGELLAWGAKTGVDYVILKFQWTGMELDVLPQLERCGELCAAVHADHA